MYKKGMSVDGEVWWSWRCKGVWEAVITFRRCDSPQGCVEDVRHVRQEV